MKEEILMNIIKFLISIILTIMIRTSTLLVRIKNINYVAINLYLPTKNMWSCNNELEKKHIYKQKLNMTIMNGI